MAKTKADWLKEAKESGIKVDATAKIADIKGLIEAQSNKPAKAEAAVEKPETETEGGQPVAESDDGEGEPQIAKAGKRSAKALKEAEEEQAKEERKATDDEAVKPKKKPEKPARPRNERRAKGYRKSAEQLERGKLYSAKEAVDLAKKTSHVKFDATVELHVRLNVDPRQADQNIRDNLVLPAGTGKAVRIAVLTDDAATAKKAGADLAGTDELLAMLEKGRTDFDVLIATPAMMPKLGKYARVLGPRGLMP
ncbi:MAG: 50S ribosomal protein L1, partial [Candidatus Saccharimonadales bacterium]